MSNSMLRDLAIKCGHRTFLGTPCRKCGEKRRRAQEKCGCVNCYRKHSLKYRNANRELCLAKESKWHDENREYLKLYREAKK
jgi:hypothetical protein